MSAFFIWGIQGKYVAASSKQCQENQERDAVFVMQNCSFDGETPHII